MTERQQLAYVEKISFINNDRELRIAAHLANVPNVTLLPVRRFGAQNHNLLTATPRASLAGRFGLDDDDDRGGGGDKREHRDVVVDGARRGYRVGADDGRCCVAAFEAQSCDAHCANCDDDDNGRRRVIGRRSGDGGRRDRRGEAKEAASTTRERRLLGVRARRRDREERHADPVPAVSRVGALLLRRPSDRPRWREARRLALSRVSAAAAPVSRVRQERRRREALPCAELRPLPSRRLRRRRRAAQTLRSPQLPQMQRTT